MKNYFVLVRANFWYDSAMVNEKRLFRITNLKDLGEQLDKEYEDTLMDFSVEWIGDEGCSLLIDDDVLEALKS